MAAGGMYDLVGGGFHRYSVDEQWLVPHFEKMLYDNALLVPAYLHAWVVTGEERYRRVAEETVDYLLRELALPEGGFASSQDADTEGVEGLTYTWTEEEGVPAELLRPFEHGRSIVRGELDPELRARLLEERVAAAAARPRRQGDRGLERARARRARRGGRRLDRDDRARRRTRLGEFLLGPLSTPGRPALAQPGATAGRASPATSRTTPTSPTASTSCTSRPGSCAGSRRPNRLARLAVELFADDERGGFFMAAHDAERLVARKKDLDDNPVPSGNSMLAYVLLRLARIYGDDELEQRAAGVLRLAAPRPHAGAVGVRLGAVRPRPLPVSAARARDHRLARRRGRPRRAGAVRPERGRRLRPERGRAAARGQAPVGDSPRSTSASASRARRRSPTRRCSSAAADGLGFRRRVARPGRLARATGRGRTAAGQTTNVSGRGRARTAPTSKADRSSVGVRPATSSATCSPTAGACWKPWPEKPVA